MTGFLSCPSDLRWCRCSPFSEHVLFPIASRSDILGSQAAKDVKEGQDALVDVFERVENFFKRLETYTEVRPTAGMTDIIAQIMVEVLGILAITTKEIKQGRTSTYPRLDTQSYLVVFLYFLREVSQEAGREDGPRGCTQEA